MTEHVFTGFGFGPIQGGLFANEAFQSGNFRRIVIAEIDQSLVDAVRSNNGTYFVNVAKTDGIEVGLICPPMAVPVHPSISNAKYTFNFFTILYLFIFYIKIIIINKSNNIFYMKFSLFLIKK